MKNIYKVNEEAVKKIAERVYDNGSTVINRNDLEEMFPELAESEDERIREKVIATIHLYYGEPLEDEAKEMIAWLEKQGEQKPAAWSEEELDSITAAINNLEYFKNNCVYHQMGLEPAITFLKSLKERYTWKPSDEQIKALAKNVEYVNVSCTQPILKGLLEDLKKLREK